MKSVLDDVIYVCPKCNCRSYANRFDELLFTVRINYFCFQCGCRITADGYGYKEAIKKMEDKMSKRWRETRFRNFISSLFDLDDEIYDEAMLKELDNEKN